MKKTIGLLVLAGLLAALASFVLRSAPPAPPAHPDLTGNYDGGTLTPLNRPRQFGNSQFMTKLQATAIISRSAAERKQANRDTDPNRGAPIKGGDANSALSSGSFGGYDSFWVDPGSDMLAIDGRFRTSIIYAPPNGQQPSMTPKARKRIADNFSSFSRRNERTAWWLNEEGPGPFDGPEELALAERCLLGFKAGPPMLPGLYNNFRRIVESKDQVVILAEMVHDARIVRLDSKHLPTDIRKWLGDAIGYWEGDTLVVDTTNFREDTGLYGGDENLHLVERFRLRDDGNLLYSFTVEDPTAWTAPWSGEYVWKRSENHVYEYACHEGNYAMGNILRGARRMEQAEVEP